MARHSGVGARVASLALAVVLVAVCIAISRSPSTAEAMRRVIAAPLTFVVAPLGRAVRGVWGAASVWSENRALKAEVARLHAVQSTTTDLANENARYRDALGFQERSPYRLVAAHVIARSADREGGGVIIDRGRADGVETGHTALSLDGLAGRVIRADEHQALVRTLNTEDSPVSVYDERSRETGILAWRAGAVPRFMLDDVPARADVQVGDLLLSTGYGGVFPRGIRVGRVTRAGIEARGLVKSIDVESSTAFGRMADILVLTAAVAPSDSLTALWLDRFPVPLSFDARRVVPMP